MMFDALIKQFFVKTLHKNRVSILCYHIVSSGQRSVEPQKRLNVSAFEEHMRLIVGYGVNFITAAQLERHYHHMAALPPYPLLITVDDGLRNYSSTMLPIFEKYHIPSVLFITTDYIDTQTPSPFVQWIQTTTRDVTRPVAVDPDYQMLSTHEIVELARNPLVEIGAHTCSHPYLSRLEHQMAVKEALDSKFMLEKILGREIRYFAYPHGDYSERIAEAIQPYFSLIFTINRGSNGLRSSPYKLRRDSLQGDLNQLRYHFMGLYDMIRLLDPIRGR